MPSSFAIAIAVSLIGAAGWITLVLLRTVARLAYDASVALAALEPTVATDDRLRPPSRWYGARSLCVLLAAAGAWWAVAQTTPLPAIVIASAAVLGIAAMLTARIVVYPRLRAGWRARGPARPA